MYDFEIRPPQATEFTQLIDLIHEHAAFENVPLQLNQAKQASLKQLILSAQPAIHCLVVAHENKLQGYTTLIAELSTWRAGYYLLMDCLYFREAARGKGLGKQMMQKIAELAKQKAYQGIQWQTPADNQQAQQFYEHLGAKALQKFRYFWHDEWVN